jgi:hypothetical protein
MNRFSIAQLGIADGFLVICATFAAQRVTTNFDKSFDFTNQRLYVWRQNMEKQVEQIVSATFKSFPPRAK